MMKYSIVFIVSVILLGCTTDTKKEELQTFEKGSFGHDYNFLNNHYEDIILLSGADSSKLIVSPGLQGRVMTSSAGGMAGQSFGWINYELIASGKIQPKIHAVGGEERFWLGPEGGQFTFFFPPGKAFNLDNWQVPKEIDTEPFTVVSSSGTSASFRKEMSLTNYSGNQFNIEVQRTVKLLTRDEQREYLGIEVPSTVKSVGFESHNTLINVGEKTWDEDYGMPSIWILSMLNPSPETIVFIPFQEGSEEKLGPIVNDVYFGKIEESRLKIDDGVIYFKADGGQRGKIGVSPQRAQPIAGSFDPTNKVLTIAMFTLPGGDSKYVNSLWELQDDPFAGDAINAYNDGPTEDGSLLGPFYEIESSSPAANLSGGERITHFHRTFHLTGEFDELNAVATKLLGVDLNEATTIL